MSSLSPAIQGLLVSLVPEYEISNDAIGYISDFSETVLKQLANEAVRLLQYTKKASVSSTEIQVSIRKTFPGAWASVVINEGLSKLKIFRNEEKDAALKQEISDFELIDDGKDSDVKITEHGKENIFLSADFIKSFLSSIVSAELSTDACIFLSSCMDIVVSKLINQSCVTLQNYADPMAITKQALLETVQHNSDLCHLAKYLKLYPSDDSPLGESKDTSDEDMSLLEYAEASTAGIELVDAGKKAASERKELPDEAEGFEEVIAEESQEPEIESINEEAEIPELQGEDDEATEPPEEPVLEEPKKEEPKEPVAPTEPQEPVEPPEQAEPQEPAEPEITQQLKEVENVSVEEPVLKWDQYVDIQQDQKAVARVRRPVVALYGKCCPYFEITSFAIHMISSILEYFMRCLLSESGRIAQFAHTRVQHMHARAALRSLTVSHNVILGAIARAECGNLFSDILPELTGCVYYSLEGQTIEREANFETYISEILLYIGAQLFLMASAHARVRSSWAITSDDVSRATLQLADSSPVSKVIENLKNENSAAVDQGEGDILVAPPPPRIPAIQMIYLTSIMKETPMQLDNQLLIIFMFLVSLSLHTLCCVR